MIPADPVACALRAGGVVAADDEADELVAFARDDRQLESWVARRLTGEPTAWITGRTDFGGIELEVDAGVYVPRRWQTTAIARHALAHLPNGGVAIDACTGCGAIAAFLAAHRPSAMVLATEVDPVAVGCARRNGVRVYEGDLLSPVSRDIAADVVVSVPPYVPTAALRLLPPDVVRFEPVTALDGGEDGLVIVARLIRQVSGCLVSGGRLVLEVGVDQIDATVALGAASGLRVCAVISDDDGDACGLCLQLGQ